MIRRSVIRVLLSLLLLLSQQMAITHVITHRSSDAALAAQVDEGHSPSKAFAMDKSCDQCLAFAQIASAVGNSHRAFVAPDTLSTGVLASADHPACARTVCVFRSRAPPAIA